MEQCQSLKALTFSDLVLDEIIRVLGAHSRPDLEIELKTVNHGRWSALTNILGNQRPDQALL
jgi:hypothetical protein